MKLIANPKKMEYFNELSKISKANIATAEISRLVNHKYHYLLEMWGDARLKALELEDEKGRFLHHLYFNENETKEVINILKQARDILKEQGAVVFNLDSLLSKLKTEGLLPPVGKNPVKINKNNVKIVKDKIIYDTSKCKLVKEELVNENDEANYIYKRVYVSPKGRKFAVIEGGVNTEYGKIIASNKRIGTTVVVPVNNS